MTSVYQKIKRLKKLIQNPFYLNEYLSNYDKVKEEINYSQFKKVIWQKKIQNNTFQSKNIHIERESCFLNIVKAKSESGGFNVMPKDCSSEALSLLQRDEIIGYNEVYGGYFITHDIYEEWGLNIIIDRLYLSSSSNTNFISQLGSNLPMRRAFRQWLSEKLIDEKDSVKTLMEEAVLNDKIEPIWKDEIFISILLSDHSDNFFVEYRDIFLKDDFQLLKRIFFLMRTGCKEIDDRYNKLLNSENNFNPIITKPKGKGWKSAIKFIYDNKDKFQNSDLNFIVPILKEWTDKNYSGRTTKYVSLFSLYFYESIRETGDYTLREISDRLIKIICNGAAEIKAELSLIFDEVIRNNWVNNQDPYFDLISFILTTPDECISIIISLPEYVLKLAGIFWIEGESQENEYYSSYGVEQYYSIRSDLKLSYSPPSALQTPILWLLKFSFKNTLDFIIDFTNRVVSNYVESGFSEKIIEVELRFDDDTNQKQYLDDILWHLYRGNGRVTSPYLLQSIHMALEKHFFKNC